MPQEVRLGVRGVQRGAEAAADGQKVISPSRFLTILPIVLRGRASTKNTSRGRLCTDSWPLTKSRSSAALTPSATT